SGPSDPFPGIHYERSLENRYDASPATTSVVPMSVIEIPNRDRLSQFGASDLNDCRQNQPHGCDRQTLREAVDPARIAQLFIAMQQRDHDVARQDDGECRDDCAGYSVEHVAYAYDVKVRLPRRYARDREGVEQLILGQNA